MNDYIRLNQYFISYFHFRISYILRTFTVY